MLVTLLLSFLLLFPSVSKAEGCFYAVASVAAGGTTCADCGTCGGCTAADLLCEDWDADNGCTWTEVETGGTIDPAADHSGTLSCTDKGTKTIDMLYTAASQDMYAYSDLGATKSTVYANFYFIVIAKPNFANGNSSILFTGSPATAGTTPAFALVVREGSSDTLEVKGQYYDEGGPSTDISAYSTINVGQWYRASFYIYSDGNETNNNDTAAFWLDGVEKGNLTTVNIELISLPRYITVGASNSDNTYTDAFHYQVENVEIDDDTMPSACP